jgi:uncharacterized secreted protein with C-terminal beta-propeller domain
LLFDEEERVQERIKSMHSSPTEEDNDNQKSEEITTFIKKHETKLPSKADLNLSQKENTASENLASYMKHRIDQLKIAQ